MIGWCGPADRRGFIAKRMPAVNTGKQSTSRPRTSNAQPVRGQSTSQPASVDVHFYAVANRQNYVGAFSATSVLIPVSGPLTVEQLIGDLNGRGVRRGSIRWLDVDPDI